jgi:hypothetical protein
MIANRTKKSIDEGDRCFGEIGTQRLKGRANRRDIVRLTESLSITEASKYQPQFGSRNILLTTCTTGWSCFTSPSEHSAKPFRPSDAGRGYRNETR